MLRTNGDKDDIYFLCSYVRAVSNNYILPSPGDTLSGVFAFLFVFCFRIELRKPVNLTCRNPNPDNELKNICMFFEL